MTAECGRNTQQMVSYRDICLLTLSCNEF
jgi:hypothetical protein